MSQTLRSFNKEVKTVREAVGVFPSTQSLEAVIDELEMSGFERHQISVLGSEAAVKEQFGKANLPVELLEDNPHTPRSPEIRREELGVGQGVVLGSSAFAGMILAAAVSGVSVVSSGLVPMIVIGAIGGTAVGAVIAKLLGERYVEFFQSQIEQGGLLVWVVTPNEKAEEKAKEILLKHDGKDVHVHDIPVDEDYNPSQ